MWASYATGLIGIAAVLLLWTLVQNGWMRMFPGVSGDPDALADRIGCAGCERRDCEQAATTGTPADEERR